MKETIAAIATGMSNSGIGIVRMSGPEAIQIIDKVFVPIKGRKSISEAKSHTIHYGNIVSEGEIIDEVLVMVMKAPASYTKEDVIEVNCHGGVFVMRRILSILIDNGARSAEPGEFTKRAFLNGRIDLSQAEAVIDVINSKNKYALRNSVRRLSGKLSEKIVKIREVLLNNLAYIEAALDDPEHISLDNFGEKFIPIVDNCQKEVDNLLKSLENGKLLTQGVKTIIVGRPNVGKSSLLNLLSGYDRAIVTDIAGTTRDVIEEQINLCGITLNLVDTAGIRDTKDLIEEIGVKKSISLIDEADLVVCVVDSSSLLDKEDYDIFNMIKDKKAVVLLNKSDLDCVTGPENIRKYTDAAIFTVSAKENSGIEEFSNYVADLFINREIEYNDEVYISGERNREALLNASESLRLVMEGLRLGISEDLYAIDIMNAYTELGKIIGESVNDDLVNEIFSKFCMGK